VLLTASEVGLWQIAAAMLMVAAALLIRHQHAALHTALEASAQDWQRASRLRRPSTASASIRCASAPRPSW